MLNVRRLSVAVLATGLVAVLVTVARFTSRAAQGVGSYKPFTASVLIKYYDGEGKLARTEVALQAIRADGSMARLVETANDKPDGMRTVSELPRSVRVTIDPLTQSLTTYDWGAREAQAERDPSGGCKYTPDAPADSVLGLAVRRYERHWTAGTREVDEEGWVAPSLGCYALKRSYEVLESGQEIGRTTSQAISITFGDPAAGLFDVPASYTERKPSEAMALHAEKLGKVCTTCMQQSGAKLDEAYGSRHKP